MSGTPETTRRLHESMVHAHEIFVQAMRDAHAAYLDSVQTGFDSLGLLAPQADDQPAFTTQPLSVPPPPPTSRPSAPFTHTISVNSATHPHLRDHTVQGAAVVPVVYAIEWCARAAKTLLGSNPPVVRNVTVLKGIRIPDLAGGIELTLTLTPDGDTVACELRSPERLHYRMQCTLSLPSEPSPTTQPALPQPATTPMRDGIYGGVLFHGPAFRAITQIDALTDTSLAATLQGVHALAWPAEDWATEPAANDGALQMALLWTEHVLAKPSLPTAIDTVHTGPLTPGPFTAILTHRATRRHSVTCDVAIADRHTGHLVTLLEGITTHAYN